MSSKRRISRRSCRNKKRHDNYLDAEVHAKQLGWPYHVYKCKFCKGYHVGRYSQKAIRAIRSRAHHVFQ